jgi:hypothetical protein
MRGVLVDFGACDSPRTGEKSSGASIRFVSGGVLHPYKISMENISGASMRASILRYLGWHLLEALLQDSGSDAGLCSA